MKKYQIILMAAVCVFSFSAAFGFNWFRKQKAATAAVLPPAQPAANRPPDSVNAQGTPLDALLGPQRSGVLDEQMGLTERQLQHLIYDVREKMRENSLRENELAQEAERIALARKSFREDIEQLNSLREKLDLQIVSLREQQEQIQKNLIEIEAVERVNLQRLATTYDRMDAVQAGRIMLSMAANNQLPDVVKILYYMNDRNAARVLGEIGTTRPEVAAVLSLQLKRVQEER